MVQNIRYCNPNGEIYHNNFAPNGDFNYAFFAPNGDLYYVYFAPNGDFSNMHFAPNGDFWHFSIGVFVVTEYKIANECATCHVTGSDIADWTHLVIAKLKL